LGQFFALTIGVIGIVGGSYVAIHGQSAAGGTIATVAIGSLAIAFITRKSSSSKNSP
jgi:ABC-type Mn2+/Zn2+ transport system permease subunit